jgi:hypothetical protein
MRRYIYNLLIWAFDTGFNVIFLGGSPYETISSRVQKRVEAGDKWAVSYIAPFICFLFRDPQHCIKARVPDSIIHNSPNWWKS